MKLRNQSCQLILGHYILQVSHRDYPFLKKTVTIVVEQTYPRDRTVVRSQWYFLLFSLNRSYDSPCRS